MNVPDVLEDPPHELLFGELWVRRCAECGSFALSDSHRFWHACVRDGVLTSVWWVL